jgi:hypothetical protein
MSRPLRYILPAFIVLLGCSVIYTQDAARSLGALSINGRVKTAAKPLLLKGKRFYLFAGGLEANKPLLDKLRAANFVSRDCYYCRLHVSPEFMAWLRSGDGNCDSPYCRIITAEDKDKVPEFKAAYQKGAAKQFAKKPILAQKWILTSLDKSLITGFYESRKSFLTDALAGLTPVQSAMTDSGTSVQALFVNVPLNGPSQKFVFSNVVPFEVGKRSYVWACEVELKNNKLSKTQVFESPETSKVVKNCEIIVHDLPACDAQSCDQK